VVRNIENGYKHAAAKELLDIKMLKESKIRWILFQLLSYSVLRGDVSFFLVDMWLSRMVYATSPVALLKF